jgi:hypothetical protein
MTPVQSEHLLSPYGLPADPVLIKQALRTIYFNIHEHLEVPQSYQDALRLKNSQEILNLNPSDNDKNEPFLEIFELFRSNPHVLAQKYIQSQLSQEERAGENDQFPILSQFESDRILYEGTFDTYRLFLSSLGPTNSFTIVLRQEFDLSDTVEMEDDNILEDHIDFEKIRSGKDRLAYTNSLFTTETWDIHAFLQRVEKNVKMTHMDQNHPDFKKNIALIKERCLQLNNEAALDVLAFINSLPKKRSDKQMPIFL